MCTVDRVAKSDNNRLEHPSETTKRSPEEEILHLSGRHINGDDVSDSFLREYDRRIFILNR